MEPNHANIYLCAVNKVSNRFKYYGTGDISQISLLKLIYKYHCYAPSYKCLQELDSMVSKLQQMDNDICLDVLNGSFLIDNTSDDGSSSNGTVDNKKPTVDSNAVTVPNQTYTFTLAEMTLNWNDPDNDGIGNIFITLLPGDGHLEYNGATVTTSTVISDPTLLVYHRNSPSAYNTSFNYIVYDADPDNPLPTDEVEMNVHVLALDNQPPTIGDRDVYATNRALTVFTIADFTTALEAPYNDPDGDLIDAIQITEISTANQGQYLYDGNPVVLNQIITREAIIAGRFTHQGVDSDTIQTDSINFRARDEGSMQWIE